MKRPGFLPVFFAILGIVFIVAVFLRIRTHQLSDELGDAMNRNDPAAIAPNQPPPVSTETVAAAEPDAPLIPDYDAPPLLDDPPLEPLPPRPVVVQPSASAPPPLPNAAAVAPPATSIGSGQHAQQERARAQSTSPVETRQQSARAERGGAAQQQPSEDLTSDSTPPHLISIEFVPPVVADGEQTLLVMHAADDLAGIRSVSGTILAPSGAVQGFAGIREGDSSRFVARVVVPKDAAEGVWAVNYLNLMDNASNSAPLTVARGLIPPTASFRVTSSRPDAEGPTLEALWIDRRSMRGGEKNLIHVRARDDQSGVNLVSGIFRSPAGQARVGFVCRSSGDPLWTCELAAPACADCGDWQLEQIQMQDKANNMTTLRAPQSELVASIRVDVSSDLCDNAPPALESLNLSENVVSNAAEKTIGVTARLSDDACGVLSVSGQATGPQTGGVPPRLYFSFTGTADPSAWAGRLVVPRLAAKGLWRISFVQVLDRGQNLKTYTQSDPLLAGATFVVQ